MLQILLAALIAVSATAENKSKPKRPRRRSVITRKNRNCERQMEMSFQWAKPGIEKQHVAVFAFNEPPVNNRIGNAWNLVFRFSIGGLTDEDFASRNQFVLFRPLENVIPKAIKVDPFETLVMGPLELENGDVVLGPPDGRQHFPQFVEYVESSIEGLDNAIRMKTGIVVKHHGAMADGFSLDENFQTLDAVIDEIQTQNPSLKSSSWNSMVTKEIDYQIAEYGQSYRFSDGELRVKMETLKFLLAALKKQNRTDERFGDLIARTEGFLKILKFELKVRENHRLKFVETTRLSLLTSLPDPSKQIVFLRSLLNKLDEAGGDTENLDRDSELARSFRTLFEGNRAIRAHEISRLRFPPVLSTFREQEMKNLMAVFKAEANPLEFVKFRVRYTVSRAVLIGYRAIFSEGLLEPLGIALRSAKIEMGSRDAKELAMNSRLLAFPDGATLILKSDEIITERLQLYNRHDDYQRVETLIKTYTKNGN